eukprot:gnl/TRDRNA2_/TRDRNA2_42775_c0_seq1.p1 gnl/TRDRNA2_/TRDRNA2_42775_c0~~gnl/TRDRNA2_/TRDRNA2_42775_c0_seq1.p1  ORF type:complete len:362 (-),score=50.18 gnl/TRDRNA2_/TRDRNA2_42775_c0_seq1:72-1157(-)
MARSFEGESGLISHLSAGSGGWSPQVSPASRSMRRRSLSSTSSQSSAASRCSETRLAQRPTSVRALQLAAWHEEFGQRSFETALRLVTSHENRSHHSRFEEHRRSLDTLCARLSHGAAGRTPAPGLTAIPQNKLNQLRRDICATLSKACAASDADETGSDRRSAAASIANLRPAVVMLCVCIHSAIQQDLSGGSENSPSLNPTTREVVGEVLRIARAVHGAEQHLCGQKESPGGSAYRLQLLIRILGELVEEPPPAEHMPADTPADAKVALPAVPQSDRVLEQVLAFLSVELDRGAACACSRSWAAAGQYVTAERRLPPLRPFNHRKPCGPRMAFLASMPPGDILRSSPAVNLATLRSMVI